MAHSGARADFATRALAAGLLGWLIVMALPQLKVTYTLIKISLLFTTEVGLVMLLLGLFLGAKTSFAGLQLIAASSVMLWLHHRAHPFAASAVGVLFLTLGLTSLFAWVPGSRVPYFDAGWFRGLLRGPKRRVPGRSPGELH